MLKVTLIGDSIRMGYQPFVKELLAEKAEVWGPEENGGDSPNVLAHLDEWAVKREADVIHVNCGLHDLKLHPGGRFQVPIEDYRKNIARIVERLQNETNAQIVWATCTPIVDARHNARKDVDFKRYDADVERYNRAALEIVLGTALPRRDGNRARIRINDLRGIVEKLGVLDAVQTDGVHLTDRAYRELAQAVARTVLPLP